MCRSHGGCRRSVWLCLHGCLRPRPRHQLRSQQIGICHPSRASSALPQATQHQGRSRHGTDTSVINTANAAADAQPISFLIIVLLFVLVYFGLCLFPGTRDLLKIRPACARVNHRMCPVPWGLSAERMVMFTRMSPAPSSPPATQEPARWDLPPPRASSALPRATPACKACSRQRWHHQDLARGLSRHQRLGVCMLKPQ